MKETKQKLIGIVITSVIVLSLSACGELSYKRGASANDFQQQKNNCSTNNKTDSEVELCLENSGWLVVNADKPLFAEATADERMADAATEQVDPDTSEPVQKAIDPLELIAIGSWWKTGAAPSALMADSEQCATELGKGHKTQSNMSLVTRGLIDCMRENGWFALKK